ncbi:hypothetical protein D3C77_502090 [compost metagenome]
MAQQSQYPSKEEKLSNSRVFTCDADNQATISLTVTSTHTNCLIQLLKNVSIRTRGLNRGRAFYSSLACRQALSKIFFSLLNHLRHLPEQTPARQREANHTATQAAVNSNLAPRSALKPNLPTPLQPSNSLIYKEFSARSAPEVGRIIGPHNFRSRGIFNSFLPRSPPASKPCKPATRQGSAHEQQTTTNARI